MKNGIATIAHAMLMLFICLVFFSACGKRFDLQKRRYNRGYYVSGIKKNENAKPKEKYTATSYKNEAVEIVSVNAAEKSLTKTSFIDRDNTAINQHKTPGSNNRTVTVFKPDSRFSETAIKAQPLQEQEENKKQLKKGLMDIIGNAFIILLVIGLVLFILFLAAIAIGNLSGFLIFAGILIIVLACVLIIVMD